MDTETSRVAKLLADQAEEIVKLKKQNSELVEVLKEIAMAAHKADETVWEQRKISMVNHRKYGQTYTWIAHKFGVSPPTVRQIVLRACKNKDPKRREADHD